MPHFRTGVVLQQPEVQPRRGYEHDAGPSTDRGPDDRRGLRWSIPGHCRAEVSAAWWHSKQPWSEAPTPVVSHQQALNQPEARLDTIQLHGIVPIAPLAGVPGRSLTLCAPQRISRAAKRQSPLRPPPENRQSALPVDRMTSQRIMPRRARRARSTAGQRPGRRRLSDRDRPVPRETHRRPGRRVSARSARGLRCLPRRGRAEWVGWRSVALRSVTRAISPSESGGRP